MDFFFNNFMHIYIYINMSASITLLLRKRPLAVGVLEIITTLSMKDVLWNNLCLIKLCLLMHHWMGKQHMLSCFVQYQYHVCFITWCLNFIYMCALSYDVWTGICWWFYACILFYYLSDFICIYLHMYWVKLDLINLLKHQNIPLGVSRINWIRILQSYFTRNHTIAALSVKQL